MLIVLFKTWRGANGHYSSSSDDDSSFLKSWVLLFIDANNVCLFWLLLLLSTSKLKLSSSSSELCWLCWLSSESLKLPNIQTCYTIWSKFSLGSSLIFYSSSTCIKECSSNIISASSSSYKFMFFFNSLNDKLYYFYALSFFIDSCLS